MKKLSMIQEIQEAYRNGENIIRYMDKDSHNTKEAILVSYDFQAGSYISAYYKNMEKYEAYTDEIANYIRQYVDITSILEAGIGDGTTFFSVIRKANLEKIAKYGFDISWSRALFANALLRCGNIAGSKVFVGDLLEIPLAPNSIDAVYTSHAIEPNGGKEEAILQELYRVTRKYLFLFEPDYSMASEEGKNRMEYHGYIKDLYGTAKKLGYQVIDYAPMKAFLNPLNNTSVLVIKKDATAASTCQEPFQCPVTHTSLTDMGEIYFAKDAKIMYPVIRNIPCLFGDYAILGSKYEVDCDEFVRWGQEGAISKPVD